MKCFAESDFEGFAAAAGVFGSGIGQFESSLVQAVGEVDDGAFEVFGANLVDDQVNVVHVPLGVTVSNFVEDHSVLHAGASAFFDVDTQGFALMFGLVLLHVPDLVGCLFGDGDDRGFFCDQVAHNLTANLSRMRFGVKSRTNEHFGYW